jgi:nitrogen fixation protein FixH
MTDQPKELTGRHVLMIFVSAFAVIIGVNLAMAFNAVSTFPGLEVKNSYIASQSFDARREAQEALGWQVVTRYDGQELVLAITGEEGGAVMAGSLEATLGRATHRQDDMTPAFVFDGAVYRAPADLAPGNWNLRLSAVAEDGTAFARRLPFTVR